MKAPTVSASNSKDFIVNQTSYKGVGNVPSRNIIAVHLVAVIRSCYRTRSLRYTRVALHTTTTFSPSMDVDSSWWFAQSFNYMKVTTTSCREADLVDHVDLAATPEI